MEYLEYPDSAFKFEEPFFDPMLQTAIQQCLKAESENSPGHIKDSNSNLRGNVDKSFSRVEDADLECTSKISRPSTESKSIVKTNATNSIPFTSLITKPEDKCDAIEHGSDDEKNVITFIESNFEPQSKFNSVNTEDTEDAEAISHSSLDSDGLSEGKLNSPECTSKSQDLLAIIRKEAADIQQKLRSPITGIEAAELVSSLLTKLEDSSVTQSQAMTPQSVISGAQLSPAISSDKMAHHEAQSTTCNKSRSVSSAQKPYRIEKFKLHRSGNAKIGASDSTHATADTETSPELALDDTLCTSPEYYAATASYPQQSHNTYPSHYVHPYSQCMGTSSLGLPPTPLSAQQHGQSVNSWRSPFEQISPLSSPEWAYLADSPNMKSVNGHTFNGSPPLTSNSNFLSMRSMPPISSRPSTAPDFSHKTMYGTLPSSLSPAYGSFAGKNAACRYPFLQTIQQPISKATAASYPFSIRRDSEKPVTTCQQCGATSTPEWRRGPHGLRTLCNACGLFHAKIARRQGPEVAMRMLKERKKLVK